MTQNISIEAPPRLNALIRQIPERLPDVGSAFRPASSRRSAITRALKPAAMA